jgi:prepilin-type N-terminal cleavage/methylation domain-containing protein
MPRRAFSARQRLTCGRPGFTLLEVVIASALILMTIAGISVCMTTVSRAAARADATTAADRALAALSERLAALPFCADALPSSNPARGSAALDLVTAVFPHACSWANDPDARFVLVDEPGAKEGSFVSRRVEDGVVVTCVASFLREDGSRLGTAEVEGFDVASSDSLPAASLECELYAQADGVRRACSLVSTAASARARDAGPA